MATYLAIVAVAALLVIIGGVVAIVAPDECPDCGASYSCDEDCTRRLR